MDVFISYTHTDNLPLAEGERGWVDDFHRALQVRVLQWLGRGEGGLEVWRDPKLAGNDVFGGEILQQLANARVLVSVLSPRYLTSEWCGRELDAFVQAAQAQGSLTIAGNRARIFKVLKMPVPRESLPAPLQPLLGYEFYRTDPLSGRPRELNEIFGDDARTAFWLQLDDLAYDLAGLLNATRELVPAAAAAERPVVYLGAATRDLRESQAALRRELERTGCEVVPETSHPLVVDELAAAVRKGLARARVAVILVGAHYGAVPEGATASIAELELQLAGERSCTGALSRLIWLAPVPEVSDARQQEFVARLRAGEGFDGGTDLLETRLEELKQVIRERLMPVAAAPAVAVGSRELKSVYLICDVPDLPSVRPLQDYLFSQGLEPVLPAFEGDEAELRLEHEEKLRICDAVLVYYGLGTDLWLGRKTRELLKIRGQGRVSPLGAQAIYVAPPATPAKEQLRTHAALVIRQPGEFAAASLAPFLEQVRGAAT